MSTYILQKDFAHPNGTIKAGSEGRFFEKESSYIFPMADGDSFLFKKETVEGNIGWFKKKEDAEPIDWSKIKPAKEIIIHPHRMSKEHNDIIQAICSDWRYGVQFSLPEKEDVLIKADWVFTTPDGFAIKIPKEVPAAIAAKVEVVRSPYKWTDEDMRMCWERGKNSDEWKVINQISFEDYLKSLNQ